MNWVSVCAKDFADLPAARDLTLQELRELVLQRNESLQSKVIDVEIGRKRRRGEWGIFEPEFVGSVDRVYNRRQNTAEQESSQLSDEFEERNNIYQSGIESLVPTGARVRLGYTMRDLNNSLQGQPLFGGLGGVRGGTNGEYQTFFGLSLTQPLLKNGGEAATLASIRVAALQSDVAFQEYRRQLMIVVSTAEAAYWNLFMAQEQVRSFRESVALAETVLKDTRTRAETGSGSELEVLEAQAGLALRKTKFNEAVQKLYEAANQVTILYSYSPAETNTLVRAVDRPELKNESFTFFDSWRSAFELNPDYLAQRQRLIIDGIRLAYAQNQRLPQLDFKASYGLNGLGDTPGHSWDDIEHGGFRSWSVGVELRVPLAGGIKARNERDVAKLNQKKALLGVKELETQIANALHTAQQKIRSRQEDVPSYESVIKFVQDLLQTEIARLEVGRVEARKVLEVEAELLEAKNSLTSALVQYRRACIEMELIEGSVLKHRGLDVTQAELESKTAMLILGDDLYDERYQRALTEVRMIQPKRELYQDLPRSEQSEAQGKEMLRALRERVNESRKQDERFQPPPEPDAGQDEELRRRLRERVDELNKPEQPKK